MVDDPHDTGADGPAAQDGVLITGLGHAGEGVGRFADGRVVFVPGAVPGDRVEPRATQSKKGVVFAEGFHLVKASAERQETPCRNSNCGGCPLQELQSDSQRRHKGERLIQTLKRIGGIDANPLFNGIETPTDLEPWRYRCRARLHASYNDGAWRLGFHGRQSNDVVSMAGCPVLMPPLDQAIAAVGRGLRGLPRAAAIKEVKVSFSASDGRAAARIICDGPLSCFPKTPQEILDWGISGLIVESTQATAGQPQEAPRTLRLGSVNLRYDHQASTAYDLWYHPGAFTQATPAVNDLLVTAVKRMAHSSERPRVLEFHSGIGNLTLPMAHAGAQVTAVENSAEAMVLAERNLYAAGLRDRVRLMQTRDVDALEHLHASGSVNEAFDVVVLDPPRAGARDVLRGLADFTGRLVYASCDIATFSRDAKTLAGHGFALEALRAFDMFPQTPHVESLGLFTKRQP